MFRVGLTGNIGAGKSTVAELFTRWGARVIDADLLAREVVAPGTPYLARLRERWGDEVITPAGALDRAAMRQIAFSDAEARRELEAILHPAILERYNELVEEAQARGDSIVVGAIPLLYESGIESQFDVVVLIYAPLGHRIYRLVSRRGLTEDEARRIAEAQMPAEEKRKRADLIIDNDSDIPTLERRAWETWKEIEKMAGAG